MEIIYHFLAEKYFKAIISTLFFRSKSPKRHKKAPWSRNFKRTWLVT